MVTFNNEEEHGQRVEIQIFTSQHNQFWYNGYFQIESENEQNPYIWFSIGIDHSNPYIHSTTVLCDNGDSFFRVIARGPMPCGLTDTIVTSFKLDAPHTPIPSYMQGILATPNGLPIPPC